jgi:hypothetical protein
MAQELVGLRFACPTLQPTTLPILTVDYYVAPHSSGNRVPLLLLDYLLPPEIVVGVRTS